MLAQMKNALIFTVALLACAAFSVAQPDTNDVIYGCTFEDLPACNIQLVPSGVFTWTWFSGSTPSLTTGPDYDHTYLNATGHYMYTEASGIQPGQIATLRLPSLTTPPQASAMCLTFWWNMYGIHIGTLNVTQTTAAGDVETIWSLSGDQGYGWNQTNVTLQGGAGSSTVVSFIGVRGGNDIGQPYGDMAIDDVFVYEGSCFAEDTTTTTPPTTTTTVPTTTPPATTTTAVPTTTVPTTTRAPATTTPAPIITTAVPTTTTPVITTVPTTASPVEETTTTSAATTTPAATTTTDPETTAAEETTAAAETTTTAATTTNQQNPAAEMIAAQSTSSPEGTADPSTETSAAAQASTITMVSTITTGASTLGAATSADTTASVAATSSASTTVAATSAATTSTATTSVTKGIDSAAGVTLVPVAQPQSADENNSTNCNNGVSGKPTPMLWGLTEDKMIIILACLCAAILLLIILVVVVSCALCITRRRYIVKKSNEIHSDNTTLDSFDGISTINTSHAIQIDNNDKLPRDY